MEGIHEHQQVYGGVMNIDIGGGGGDRFPQWSSEETRELLMIRGEFEPSFMETKRNKLLWEAIATHMRERGYNRSGQQCKCKWKNLVTRYKGCQTLDDEGMRQQFPFYNELHAIFTARMQKMLWMEAEGGGGKKKKAAQLLSSDEEDDNNSEGEKGGGSSRSTTIRKKRRMNKNSSISSNVNNNNPRVSRSSEEIISGMKEMLEDLMKQQMQMEKEWVRAHEAREEERRMKEMEFRQIMERLENERLMMEMRWREREEQRKMREDVRAEKRDALFTALLNKLISKDDI